MGKVIADLATSAASATFAVENATSSVDYVLSGTDGSANDHLKTDGSGNLAWVTPASADVVKITSGNLTGAGTISIDGHFSSTYLNYRIIFDSILTDTDGSDVNIRVNTSGSADTSSNYYYASARTYLNSGTSAVDSVKSGWAQDKWLFDDGLEDDNKPAVIDLMIYNPQSTSVTKVMMCDFWNLYSSGTQYNNHRVGMNWNLTTALTGVTIFLSSGNFETSTDTSKNNWTLYGYKN